MPPLRGEHYAEQITVTTSLNLEQQENLYRIKAYYGLRNNSETLRFIIAQRARLLKQTEVKKKP